MGQSDRPRWQIAVGLSGIDTMNRRSERRNYCGRNDDREDGQRHLGTSLVAPIEIVHKQHLPRRNRRSARGQFRWCFLAKYRALPFLSRLRLLAVFHKWRRLQA